MTCETDLSEYPLVASRVSVPLGLTVATLCPASCAVCVAAKLPRACDPVRQPLGHYGSAVEAVLGTDSAHTGGFTAITFGTDGSLQSNYLRSWICFPALEDSAPDLTKEWLKNQWWSDAQVAFEDDSLSIVPLWRDIVRGVVEDDKVNGVRALLCSGACACCRSHAPVSQGTLEWAACALSSSISTCSFTRNRLSCPRSGCSTCF